VLLLPPKQEGKLMTSDDAPLASVTMLRTDRPFASSEDGRSEMQDGEDHFSGQPDPTEASPTELTAETSPEAESDPTAGSAGAEKVAPTTSKPPEAVPEPRSQCRAMAKNSQMRCGQRPMPGQLVCFWHGGAAPQARRAAEKRLAKAEAAAEVASRLANTEAEPIADPLDALSRLAGEVQQMRRVLADRVNRADDPASIQAAVDLAAYERALDRSTRLLDVLARSGFEERRVVVAEEQGRLFAGVQQVILARMLDAALGSLFAYLGDADYVRVARLLEQDWTRAVSVVVPEELRALARRADL
jgi:hypothetical protein